MGKLRRERGGGGLQCAAGEVLVLGRSGFAEWKGLRLRLRRIVFPQHGERLFRLAVLLHLVMRRLQSVEGSQGVGIWPAASTTQEILATQLAIVLDLRTFSRL